LMILWVETVYLLHMEKRFWLFWISRGNRERNVKYHANNRNP
jgi:hypothetical protein